MVKNLFKKVLSFVRILFINFTYQIAVFFIELLSIRMLQVCYRIRSLNYSFITGLILSGIIIYYIYIKLLNKKIYRYAALCILFVFAFVFFLAYMEKIIQFAVYLFNLMGQINENIYKSKDTFGYQYMPFMIGILPLCTLFFMCLYEHRKGYISAIAALAFLMVLWYTGFDYDIRNYCYLYIFLVAVIFTISTFNTGIYDYGEKKYKVSVSRKRITVYMISCCILVALCGVLFKEALGVKSIPEAVEEAAAKYSNDEVGTGDIYDLAKSGYSENAKKLGGPLTFNTDIAMRVKAEDVVYLRGTVKDNYNGSIWSKSTESFKDSGGNYVINADEKYKEYFENNREPEESVEKKKMIVYPESLDVSTLFAPLYAINIVPADGYFRYDDSFSFIFQDGRAVKKPYTIEYYATGGKIIRPGITDKRDDLILYSTGDDLDQTQKVYYDEHIKSAYEKYLQLPGSISDDTKRLVKNITDGCKSSSEKVYKIQEYLTENYIYSPDVPNVPEGKDFLDYFLFTEKEGYCTYFATASTIFCRIAGIPARYVEGFRMDPIKDDEGLYIVGNEMAHAWTEVLTSPENDIWVTLDSTPENTQTATLEEKQAAARSRRQIVTSNGHGIIDGNTVIRISIFGRKIWRYVLVLFLVSIIVFVLYSIVSYHRKVKFVCCSGSIIPLYNHTKTRLKSAGLDRFINIDDEKWISSIDDNTIREWLKTMVDAAYAEFYGRRYSKDFNKKGMCNYIEEYIKDRQNIFKYILQKYFIK